MIFSRWDSATGRYDYFESNDRIGLGDDLPVPSISPINGIGVASTEIGRAMPSSARPVGTGTFARGMVSPMNRSRSLGAIGVSVTSDSLLMLAFGVGAGWFLWGRKR